MINTYLSYTLAFLGLLLLPQTMLQAQDASPVPNKWAIQAMLHHQDLPLQFEIGQLGVVDQVRLRPAYSVEAQRHFFKNPAHKFILSARAGYHHNPYHDRWATFQLGIGYEARIFKKFFLGLRTESGWAAVKNSDVVYRYETDRWVETPHFAKAKTSGTISLRADLGYRLVDGIHPIDLITNAYLMLHHNLVFEEIIPYYGIGVGARVGL